MPIDYKEYPDNWKEISRRIRFDRAGNKCEWCGVRNGAIGYREADGTFVELDGGCADDVFVDECNIKVIKIVLTVAHLNHIKDDVRDENLAALCQRCHLLYDMPRHVLNRKYGKRKNQLSLNLGD